MMKSWVLIAILCGIFLTIGCSSPLNERKELYLDTTIQIHGAWTRAIPLNQYEIRLTSDIPVSISLCGDIDHSSMDCIGEQTLIGHTTSFNKIFLTASQNYIMISPTKGSVDPTVNIKLYGYGLEINI